MNEQAEQTIRLLVFAADSGQREKAPAQRGGQAERQADGHQQERRTDMRDEGGSQRGARFADEGFVSGDIPCVRAGIEFALDRAAHGDARKTEERERHQHGFDSGMNQREEEGREHERQQKGWKGEFARGALVESPEKSIEFLKGAGEPFGQFGRGTVEDEREKKRGGKSEETHGKDLPFGRR